MFIVFLKWCSSSLAGHLTLSTIAVALPIFLLGFIVNVASGYPTADMGILVGVSELVAILPAFFVWYGFTAPRIKRKQQFPAISTPIFWGNQPNTNGLKLDAQVAVADTLVASVGAGAKIHYRWRYDANYYTTVIGRYYKQLPRIRHLWIQYTLLWLIGVLLIGVWLFLLTRHDPLLNYVVWTLLTGAVGIPGCVFITKQGILLRFRLRSSFDTDANFFLSETGVAISQKSSEGTYSWATYNRAVRFSDGLLLLKAGTIRWLPDSALQIGTIKEAVELVRTHLPIRLLDA